MTIRLYLDEDSSDTNLLKALRLRGVDVLGAPDSGMLGRNDDEQLKWAASQQRALYSSNRADFYRIHSEFVRRGEDHFGIILGAQQRYTVGEQMRRLLHLTNRLTAQEMRNRVEFITAWG